MVRKRRKYQAAKKPMGAVAITWRGMLEPGIWAGTQKCAAPKQRADDEGEAPHALEHRQRF